MNSTGQAGINSAQVELLMANYTSGMQLHGKISAVRRFFCLIVTFDLCFTFLFWIICILVDGTNIIDALKEQIMEYSIKTSIFDVVGFAGLRFLFLILFYALIHINHWWLVAVVTTMNCAFLIAKAFLYQWSSGKSSTSHPFEVMLVLFSFLISWVEAWFIDFRVIPQEAKAKSIEGAMRSGNSSNIQGIPQMSQVREYLSHYTESIFYSPLGSPDGSEDESVKEENVRLTEQEKDYVQQATIALRESLETLNSVGWNHEKTLSVDDVILSRKCSSGRKIFKLTAVIDAPAERLFNECQKNFESIPQWNKAIVNARLVQTITTHVDVTYQLSAESPGGVISPRDFVGVRQWSALPNGGWAIGGISTEHPDAPPVKNAVRGENGPNCVVFTPVTESKCCLQMLLDVDLKIWVPKYITDQALVNVLCDFLKSAKNFAPTLCEVGE